MLPGRFVITQLDFAVDRGYVLYTQASIGPLLPEQISFVISGVAQAFFRNESSYGICVPDQATRNRIPVVGEELAGVIAANCNDTTTAFDSDGNPFLRNWVYGDQYDAVMALVEASTTDEPDDDVPYDDEDESDEEHDECPNGCGQPAYACTCAELASLQEWERNPETRGSYWTA